MEISEINEPPRKKFKYCWGESAKSKSKKDFSELPPDVLLSIFQYLDYKSICHCAILCRTFSELSNDHRLYKTVNLKYNMDTNLMTSYINKIAYPKHINIEYKIFEPNATPENYSEFDEYVTWLIRKCSEQIRSINLENCRNENVLVLLLECHKLEEIRCQRCKGNFDSLTTLKNVTSLSFISCDIPTRVLTETLQNNSRLKKLWLSDNSKINVNDICQTLSRHNYAIEEIHFCDNKRAKAKGLKALARCSKLRMLELIGGPLECDPEDSLEQLAVGCPLLERLTIHGWKEINDENLLPILHFCTQLKQLDLRGIDITIRSCREAALSLPLLQTIDINKCSRIKQTQIARLQRDFQDIQILN